jgi:two-component system chemotaxis sensor kinase CheA
VEREKYLSLFVDESKENLQALNDYLLELEKGSGDLHLLNDVFRVAHTLKGMSSTMGFKEMASLTHEMESLLDLLRNAQLAINTEIIDVLFLCLDNLEVLADNVTLDNPNPVDTTNLMYRLKKLIKRGTGSIDSDEKSSSEDRDNYSPIYDSDEKNLINESIENGYIVSEIDVLIMKESAMKAIRVFLILQAVESKGKIIKTTPSREELSNEKFGRNFVITLVHSLPIDEIKNSILSIAEVIKVYSEELKTQATESSVLVNEEKKEILKKIEYNETEKNVLFEALNQNYKCYEIYITFSENTIMKAVRASMVVNTLQNIDCQIIKSIPSNNDLVNNKIEEYFIITVISENTEQYIKESILDISEINQVEILELAKSYIKEDTNDNQLTPRLPKLTDYEKLMISQANNIGKRVILIGIHLMSGTVMKYARYILVTKRLENLGEIIKTIPSQDEIELENFNDFFEIVFSTSSTNDSIINSISSVAEITDILELNMIISDNLDVQKLIPIEITKKNESKVNNILEEKNVSLNNKFIKEKQVEEITPQNISEPEISKINNEIKNNDDKKIKKTSLKKPTLRVDIERLDELVNLIEELTIVKSRLNRISSELNSAQLTQVVRSLSILSGNLQSNAMSLRMVPIEQVFSRFPRMIRDVAKSLNKEINFIIEGEDTELDRTIIDEIGDPLVHLLRNSVDHGIESIEKRLKSSKSEVGTIRLIACHEGNNVLIIVEDDGGGIDIQKVKNKALEKSIINTEQADNMSDDEAIRIIFLPGFSTMETTTDLSGRGVGMDAVLSKVQSIGGTININSEFGKGSRFTIKLPLTLAIMRVLLVECGDEIYAIPITFIEEVKEFLPEEIKTINQVKITVIRDRAIPLLDLGAILNVKRNKIKPPIDTDIYTEIVPTIIVKTEEGKKLNGLIVDNILGQEDIVIKPLGRIASDKMGYVTGTANLGDGNLALILNISNIT